MNCPKCGTTLDAGARFCGACGSRMGNDRVPVDSPHFKTLADVPPGIGHVMTPAPAARPAAAPPLMMPAPAPAPAPARSPLAQSRPAPADPLVGRILENRYVVETKLGQGGFGAVYKGKQITTNREVAIKILHPDSKRDPNLVARFRREGEVSCRLSDPHTVTTFDCGQTDDGVFYIAMELLKGRSLHEVFHAEAPVPWKRMLRIVEQMCSSLGEAHAQGIVHRDIKPENVYLEDRAGHHDFVKLLDFGIAKIVSGDPGSGNQAPQLTATGQTLGTLEYMSPEQLMGKKLDGRSDIYAVGVVTFELLTGRLPFPEANGPADLIHAQLRKVPPLPSEARPDAAIPPGVDQVVMKMLEKTLDKRFQNVDELKTAVSQVLASGGAPVLAAASTPQLSPQQQHVIGSSTVAAKPGSLPGIERSPLASPPRAMARPPGAVASAPPVGQPGGQPGPSTSEALAASAKSSRLWLWITLGAVGAAAGAVGAYFAFAG